MRDVTFSLHTPSRDCGTMPYLRLVVLRVVFLKCKSAIVVDVGTTGAVVDVSVTTGVEAGVGSRAEELVSEAGTEGIVDVVVDGVGPAEPSTSISSRCSNSSPREINSSSSFGSFATGAAGAGVVVVLIPEGVGSPAMVGAAVRGGATVMTGGGGAVTLGGETAMVCVVGLGVRRRRSSPGSSSSP